MRIIELNDELFQEEVINKKGKYLIDFNANWCGPCRMMAPILENYETKNSDLQFASVNIDDNEDLASKYNVSSIPCLILMEDGEEVKRNVGLINEDELRAFLGEE